MSDDAQTDYPQPTTRPWLAAYADGVPSDIDPVTGTLVDLIDEATTRYAKRTALEFFGRETSYRELSGRVSRAAEGLRRLGVGAGDRVALLLPNCPQHVIAFYAILRLGAVVVEHNPLYTDRELRHLFEDHGAKVAVSWDKLVDRLVGMPADLRFDHIVSVDATLELPASKRLALRLPLPAARSARGALTAKVRAGRRLGVSTWAALEAGRPLKRTHPRPHLDDIALLQYTSGTTGLPKGAILSHRNLRSNVEQGRAWVPGLRDGAETVYGVLPFFHAYGLTLCLTFAMRIGARLVLFPKFDVDLVLAAAKKHPPTFLPAVPPIYARLAAAATSRRSKRSLATARFAISGAMNLPAEVVTEWERVTKGLLVEGFGLTETSPVALGNPVGPSRRSGTVGVPFPSTYARVVKRDDVSVEVGHDEPGELLLKGPQVFQGYWRRPDETAAVLLPDGWFRTGDIVTMSADGYVTIVDRIKELIVTGGFNVAPSEVEEALHGVPGVAEAAVVGLPRGGGGEDVTAVVVMRPGATFDEKTARAHCRDSLAAYKVPKHIYAWDELPKNLIGKTLRRVVRERLIASDA